MSEQPQIPIKKLIRRRVTMLYLLFFLLAVVIVVRLVCIQFASPETAAFAQVLSKRILTTKTVTARRGDILMRGCRCFWDAISAPRVMVVTISVEYSVRTMPGGLVTSGATAAVIRPSNSSLAWLTMSSGSS